MAKHPLVQDFFDEATNTFSYVVSDPITKRCAIIDSVLDYDAASATTSTTQADRIIAYVKAQTLDVEWILETHVHADHLTAAQYLKQELGGKIAISQKIAVVQQTFAAIYNLDLKQVNASQPFDHLFEDGEHFKIGELDVYNIATPGHTPACLSYVVEDAVLSATRCLCRTMVRPVVIFQKVVQKSFLIRYKACISSQKIHGPFYVMTICLKHVNRMCVKPLFRLRKHRISIFTRESVKLNLLRCETSGIQDSACRS